MNQLKERKYIVAYLKNYSFCIHIFFKAIMCFLFTNLIHINTMFIKVLRYDYKKINSLYELSNILHQYMLEV